MPIERDCTSGYCGMKHSGNYWNFSGFYSALVLRFALLTKGCFFRGTYCINFIIYLLIFLKDITEKIKSVLLWDYHYLCTFYTYLLQAICMSEIATPIY